MTDIYTHPEPVTPVLRTPLISEMIKELHLKTNSPYPSEELRENIASKRVIEEINQYRRSQEHVTLKEVK
jgi:uncharacterized protein YkwD